MISDDQFHGFKIKEDLEDLIGAIHSLKNAAKHLNALQLGACLRSPAAYGNHSKGRQGGCSSYLHKEYKLTKPYVRQGWWDYILYLHPQNARALSLIIRCQIFAGKKLESPAIAQFPKNSRDAC